jgi:phytoene/squalene synthetase
LIVPPGSFETPPVHPGPGFPLASLRYFVWLYSPQQRVVQSLLGLEREIAGAQRAVTEHQVVHVRLEWWRAEAERVTAGNPIHPLTRALSEEANKLELPAVPNGLSGFVDVATWDLAGATFETRREVTAYCLRWSAAMFGTIAAFAKSPAELEAVRSLGAAVREIELLAELAREANAGRLRLPLDELERAGADPRALTKPPWPDAIVAAVRDRAVALQASVSSHLDELRRNEPERLRSLFVWAGLALRLARRIERALPGPVTPGRADTLAESWQAWRAARAARAARSARR